MARKVILAFTMVACGGQVIGGIDGGGTDATAPDAGGSSCTSNAGCAMGQICGFPESEGCSAQSGQCFQAGAVCNLFSPGCACDGKTINIACTGLPPGYSTAPLSHSGTCDGG